MNKPSPNSTTAVNIPFKLSANAYKRFEELRHRGYSLARIVGIGLYHVSVDEHLPVDISGNEDRVAP
jgi:hypothetical protein